jgi:hypothetical protein
LDRPAIEPRNIATFRAPTRSSMLKATWQARYRERRDRERALAAAATVAL